MALLNTLHLVTLATTTPTLALVGMSGKRAPEVATKLSFKLYSQTRSDRGFGNARPLSALGSKQGPAATLQCRCAHEVRAASALTAYVTDGH